jgi:meiotically up-regulated gene 157 (Mug157) protein
MNVLPSYGSRVFMADANIPNPLSLPYLGYAGTVFMHESFDRKRPEDFTRAWFGWANSLFGEQIVQLYRTRSELFLSLFP